MPFLKMKESPLFTKSYQFLLWIMQKTEKFPKSQRFGLAARLNHLILNFHDLIIETTKVKEKLTPLIQADMELEKLRVTLRICKNLKLINIKQYEYAAQAAGEIGKMLGSWIKKEKK